MGDTVPLFNPNDGLTGRNGGPYLDEEQARADEIKRARVEGREPDLDNPGANAGIQLSTAAQMLATLNVTNTPSMEVAQVNALNKAYKDAFDNRDDDLTSPVSDEIPDTSGQKTLQDLDRVTLNTADPNAPATQGTVELGGDDDVEFDFVGEGSDALNDKDNGQVVDKDDKPAAKKTASKTAASGR